MKTTQCFVRSFPLEVYSSIESKKIRQQVRLCLVDSFGVFEEQLSSDVAEAAEALFTQKCESAGITPDEIEDAISDGYIEIEDEEGDIMLSIVWSSIE